MKRKKLIIIIILLLILIPLVIFTITKINYNSEQKNLLTKEISLLVEKDLLKDNYDIITKTDNKYSIVEKSIKSYYKEISDNTKTIYTYLNDEALIKILSADNLSNDKPNFDTSINTITTTRENINNSYNRLIELLDKKEIDNYLNKENISNYYYKLYLDYMYNDEELLKIRDIKEDILEVNTNLNTFLDKVEAIITMLKNNNKDWYIEDGILYFETDSLVGEYNNLYNDLNTYVKETFSNSN